MIEAFLRDVGLNTNEVQVYLYLLRYGESIASIVSKRLGIKRPTIYQALETLEEKELVSSFQKNNVRHFMAKDPKSMVDYCEKKQIKAKEDVEKAKDIEKELRALDADQEKAVTKPYENIQYYEGLTAVTNLIDRTLDEGHNEHFCFGLNTYHTELGGNDWKNYTKKRVEQNMKVYSIQPNTKEAKQYKKRDIKELRETRLVPKEEFPCDCEINIFDDMIAMFSFSEKVPTGMKLRNKKMAEALRSLFKLAWKEAKQYNTKK